ncbi:MAG TPA: TolC family protein [Longimicrobiales bacterium]|nr:TolC family protein [Longimicrobiales bacterium]
MSKCTTGLGLLVGLALAIPMGVAAQDPTRPVPQVEPYQVGHALPPVDPGATILNMTLEDAIQRALETNLDIQSARLNPEIQDYSMVTARAAFSPTLSMTYGYNNSTNQSTSQLDGGARTSSERMTFNTSMAKTMPWWGGRLNANFNNSRTETNNAFTTRNPSYNSQVSFNYTQPLLAGRSTDNQRAALETQLIQADITDLQLQTQIANITHQVRLAYWSLRSTIEQIEIQRRSLAQARQLLEENRIRVQLGRMTELQLVQAEAQVASAEQSLLNAEIQWRNQEFAFKRLLLGGPDDQLLTQTVNPVDQPALVDQAVDIQAAIDVALAQRTDIRQQRQQRDISEISLRVNRSNSLPELNLTAAYSLQGVGGDLFSRSELGGEPVLVQPGGYSDGLRSIGEFDTPTWSLTLNASYPLGANVNKANLERARLQLRQAELALRSQELLIITQVTTAGLAVRNTYLQYEAARRNREAAERAAETELLRYSVGVATNFEVVQAQNALTTARLSELNAIISHTNAITEFERVRRVGGG